MNQSPVRLAILASGNGTNAEAIMRYFQRHEKIRVALLLSNNPEAFALKRATKFTIPTRVFNREQFKGQEIVRWLKEEGVTHVVLAGFLWLVPPSLLHAFPNKIINIHPSLLPKHGGKGMYGDRVHEAVKDSGDKKSGITIHLVNENFDEGRIIFQAECPVEPADTPQSIAAKVHALEHLHYPRVLEEWVSDTRN